LPPWWTCCSAPRLASERAPSRWRWWAALRSCRSSRDLATSGTGEARLLNLVTYNYQRAWPEGLGFAAPCSGWCGLRGPHAALGLTRLRRFAGVALVGGALGFALFGLNVYLPHVAPHWGQRELIEAYYRARKSERDPLAAYNFYTATA
jgi:hypothetical protein